MRRERWSRTAAVGAAVLVLTGMNQAEVARADTAISTVTLAGDLDQEIGCPGDWQPGCAAAHLALRSDGLWGGSFTLPANADPAANPAGSYQYKMAINDSFAVSYGDGAGGGNLLTRVPAGGATVTFLFDPVSKLITDSVTSVTAVGDFQTQLGCAANNSAACPQSWVKDTAGSGVYTLSSGKIGAGTYHLMIATDFGTGPSYGVGGQAGGAPVAFTVPSSGGGATTTISYHATTHAISVTSVPLIQAAPAVFSHPTSRRGDVIANLFEWNWKSVAAECTSVLGPAGYGGVQVSPPQDSITKTDGPIHPWWEVYQPVDYGLTSRMGNEAQFKSMVKTCRAAGVHVYVDTVINHMTGQGNASYGGKSFTKYDYPGIYSAADFHHAPADCPQSDGTIHDFNNYLEVTKCELVGLSDLRTETEKVRSTVAKYMNKLLSYGVSGFRVDAAKHIGQVDLSAIERKLHRTVDGIKPYIALEVPPGGPGALSPFAFQRQGNLLGFDFALQVKAAFNSNISAFAIFGESAGLLPSSKSMSFVQNHDSERNGDTLSYKDGPTNTLANEFMLAYGYGRPNVYSGYAFTDRDASPPADANGFVTDTDCSNGWACTHRSQGIANMVDFHNYTAGAPVKNFWSDRVNMISFSRGARGWIAINNELTPQTRTLQTGLATGKYCDIIHGTFRKPGHTTTCSGPTVTVKAGGWARVTVPAKDSVAFDAGDRMRG